MEQINKMERINRIITSEVFQQFLQQLASRENSRFYCTHGWEHLIAVSRIAYITALEQDGLATIAAELIDLGSEQATLKIKEVIYTAGLLHDFGRLEQYLTGEDHAQAGARLALPVLVEAGYNPVETRLITHAIECHRLAKGHHTSYLAQIIAEADNLARQCNCCRVKLDCHKIERMTTAKDGLLY